MYICIEEFVTEDGTHYELKETISEVAYAFMQPSERENFEKMKNYKKVNE